jgi:hypothetical protein
MDDHDQRFKELLHEFLPEFLRLFYPDWADRLDLGRVEWVEQEAHLDPPRGERRVLDLVAKVASREPVPDPAGRADDSWLILINVEVEAADRAASLRARLWSHYHHLRQKYGAPVAPIGLYLRVGLEGVGWDAYEERLWDRTLLRFEYAYVGLPALDGEAYIRGDNLLGVALAALMRIPKERQAELRLEALARLARSGENDARKYMLVECVENYFPLDPEQRVLYERLEESEQVREVRAMAIGWKEQGRQIGCRHIIERLLEKRFGPLPPTVRQRLEQLGVQELERVADDILDSSATLASLGLSDE